MLKALTSKYANVSCDAVTLYKELCEECVKKRKRPTRQGVVVRPIITNEFGSRGQVDLVDMHTVHGSWWL